MEKTTQTEFKKCNNKSMTIRYNIKTILKKLLPLKIFKVVNTIYIKIFANIFKDNDILEKYLAEFKKNNANIIIDGPFKGLHYVDKAVGSTYLHKMAGYYEAVLIPFIQEAFNKDIKNILDIGAAEGYYTTGFGKHFPEASIVAFEIEDDGRRLIQEMYNINNLTNTIHILGEATNQNIVNYITPNTLLICDIEGAEKDILNIENKDIYKNIEYGIIELHDDFIAGCEESVKSYFQDTHNVDIVTFKFANPQEFTFLKSIENKKDLHILLKERGIQDQNWIILRKR